MGRYFDSGDAFSGAGKKEDPLESAVEKRETLAVVQGQLDSESSEAAKEAAEVARKNAAAEAAFKKKFGNVKPSAGALLHNPIGQQRRGTEQHGLCGWYGLVQGGYPVQVRIDSDDGIEQVGQKAPDDALAHHFARRECHVLAHVGQVGRDQGEMLRPQSAGGLGHQQQLGELFVGVVECAQ